jgi:hypothetical protein
MRALFAAAALLALLAAASATARADEGGTVGATVFVDPLTANLKIKPSSVQVAHEANARSTIVNQGPAPLGAVTATLLIDAQGVTVVGGATRTLSGIAAHSSVDTAWRLCGARPGSYLAMVKVSSTDGSGRAFEAETAAVLLEVTGARGRAASC